MNSAEWSWTSCRVDRPALAAATDHNPARFGIQLSCVTPPPVGWPGFPHIADVRASALHGYARDPEVPMLCGRLHN